MRRTASDKSSLAPLTALTDTCPLAALVAVFLLTATPAGFVHAQTATIEGQRLVGSWTGTWTEISRGLTGRYTMAIEQVAGDVVTGSAEMEGRKVPVPPFRLSGKLAGNRLSYGARVKTELVIDGDRMAGSTTGANHDVDIVLLKDK